MGFWIRNAFENKLISIRHIVGIVIEYYNKSEILQWSTTYICSELTLSDNNKAVTRKQKANSPQTYAWITADTEPVFEAVHCWRIKTINPSLGWICWGVAAPMMLRANTFNEPRGFIWAIALNNCWYPTYSNINDQQVSVDTNFKKKEIEVDILLDLDKKELRFCANGLLDEMDPKCKDEENGKQKILHENEPKMWNFPIENKIGWCPHINMGTCPNTTSRVAKIPIECYGVKIDNLFASK